MFFLEFPKILLKIWLGNQRNSQQIKLKEKNKCSKRLVMIISILYHENDR